MTKAPDPSEAPHSGYRPCVGAVILNADGHVWIGRRTRKAEGITDAFPWQMPQGGIDRGEDTAEAARREVHEETGMHSLKLIAEAPAWYAYDLPAAVLKYGLWKGRYKGQTQKWYAFRFI
ncbi:MAG: RNA pyrophosphohydrolase, partial [Pseudomonadota bacterium]